MQNTIKNINPAAKLGGLIFIQYSWFTVYGSHGKFHDYLNGFECRNIRNALIELFRVLNTKCEDRDPYLNETLASFPYVNGGLFADENIEIPQFNDEIKDLLLNKASENFDWKDISPTIFGSVFESTLNPMTRHHGGMHYTSINNIHKVIDPLFLDELKEELQLIKENREEKSRNMRLENLQNRLSSLIFLDPACGSGNFLTETYISLRRIENEILKLSTKDKRVPGQISMAMEGASPIKVSIAQFYGIEINDFAVTVAKTALWIAESQMMEETEGIVHMNLDFLPLKTYANIHESNALLTNWDDIISRNKLSYIIGNPPFLGLSYRSDEQQKDMEVVFNNNSRSGRLDYVAAWYEIASEYMKNTNIEAAFVSTNSITQGEQVPILWESLLIQKGLNINFAYSTFSWENEASNQAAVHCVIIGFSYKRRMKKHIYSTEGNNIICREVNNINGYLVNSENIFIKSRGQAPDGFPQLKQGSKPWDGGYLILSDEERNELVNKYPEVNELIKLFIGSREYINRKTRWCLWLENIDPNKYMMIPEIMERINGVRNIRLKTKTAAVQKQAEIPMLFSQIRQPKSKYILIPETSSSTRRYPPVLG